MAKNKLTFKGTKPKPRKKRTNRAPRAPKTTTFQKTLVKVGDVGVSALFGFGHGALKAGVGDDAALYYRVAAILAGIGTGLVIDENKHPTLAKLGMMALVSGASLEGSWRGEQAVEAYMKHKEEQAAKDNETRETAHNATLSELRAEIASLEQMLQSGEGRITTHVRQQLLAELRAPNQPAPGVQTPTEKANGLDIPAPKVPA